MSYLKVIVSGNVLEVYEMDKVPISNWEDYKRHNDNYDPLDFEPIKKDISAKQLNLDDLERLEFKRRKYEDEEKIDRKEERRKQTTRDARNKVRRLVLSNFDNNSKFLTLTFKENITDIEKANKIFGKYIKKLRKYIMPEGQKLKYLAVIEFQKRGAIHYHMICNIPYTPHGILWSYWKQCIEGEGAVNIQNIKDVDNVGAYIVKYMVKDVEDKRLRGKKCYLPSQGLEQPKVFTQYNAWLVLQSYEKETKKEIYRKEYPSDYLGNIVYKEYNLNQNKKYREKLKKKSKK